MDERLKKIEARAKALGWDCKVIGENPVYAIEIYHESVGKFFFWPDHKGNLEAAEDFLSLREPGPWVRVYPSAFREDGTAKVPVIFNDPGTYKFTRVNE